MHARVRITQAAQCKPWTVAVLYRPLLGLFGIEDTRPSPADAAKTEEALKRYNKTYEFHTYEKTGHAFFAVDRQQYRVQAALDGWKRVFAWFDKYLH